MFFPGANTFPGSTRYPGIGGGIFRGVLCQRYMPVLPPLMALMNYSKAVLRIQGQWVETEFPTQDQINSADLYFPGGYGTPIDATTAATLLAAGYTIDTV